MSSLLLPELELDFELPELVQPPRVNPFLAALETLLPPGAVGEGLPGQRQAEARYAAFVAQAWDVIEPETTYLPNWHVDAIADHLEAMCRLEIRNLLITMPPRMLKSLGVSVFFPAWRWITAPGERFLYTSYSADLATEHGLGTRRIVESEWYRSRWGDRVQLAPEQRRKTRFETSRRGARVALSIGGAVTGKGGDWVIVDDPHNVKTAESAVIREETVRWWDEVMSSRFNNPKTGKRIVVMQRVHEKDLAGHLIERGNYVHLNLPMEYEPQHTTWTGFGQPDPRTAEGELLHPERIGPEEVAGLKIDMGPNAFAGQYQQRPVPAGGALVKREWFAYWRPPLPDFELIIQSWDTAFKDGQQNDYTAGWTIGQAKDGWYVLDRWHDKVLYPGLKRGVIGWYERWRPDEVVVEDAASGQSLLQDLDAETRIPATAAKGPRDKVIRISSITGLLEAGKVKLPAEADWLETFLAEATAFPLGEHDDQIDSLAIGIRHLAFGDRALRPASEDLMARWQR